MLIMTLISSGEAGEIKMKIRFEMINTLRVTF